MNLIVNHPKNEMARQVMNRLKRMNVLTVEIIRKFWDRLNARKLITIFRKRQWGRELLLEQETPVKEI